MFTLDMITMAGISVAFVSALVVASLAGDYAECLIAQLIRKRDQAH